MPRKKKSAPRVRRDPYAKALERANARLDKAITERDKCAQKLTELTVEIPRLQDMIAGIERFMGVTRIAKEGPMPPSGFVPKLKSPNDDYGRIQLDNKTTTIVPQPRDLTVEELPDEDDSLLPDAAGKELLP